MTSHQKIIGYYVAFAICVVTACIPHMTVQTFSMIFALVSIITFYVMRKNWAKNTSHYTEASFVIKSFWIWSAIYVVGMLVAGILISTYGDMTVMNEWAEKMMQGGVPDEAELKHVTQEYLDTNMAVIVKMTLLSIAPAQIYAIWRIKTGLTRILRPSTP
jgi:uncharacterized membrane protein